ncbi:MAG TPA: N-acetylglucosamine/diacetylchitobiose ABC transporter substrate-binding protein [Stackebrandtia sp.]|jgi:N-acetylglucosamine transport system substrate-binding protein|uniref:N-acetylglucosamine/diacetylchitobiose ABC transporter substrate-binding protein n=1 Tax=Stackebrandtia sp. TaxID=2023065 RepID=UPI002D615B1D|nr:N-acetylglucosamine/diacetylchitobiose ABC transporter substrate-binding protein [Stackebrandtia sp.]HZE40916.1 N-acetylglucosamine/diacetylchitobiose ABC transporter substrate-binding protein [Stackebrandtia sp.]
MTRKNDSSELSRRRVLQGTALGAAAIPAAGLLGACATSGTGGDTNDVKNSGDAKNPFKVDGSKALEVVVFNGGFGTDYADTKSGHLSLYKKKFPKASVKLEPKKDIASSQKPRFTDGTPPDVMDDSGAKKIALDALIKDGQLAELTPLLDAPSYDDPKVKVKDTLAAGTLKPGTFTDPKDNKAKVYALPYFVEAWSIWYDSHLFKQKGWDVPATWEDMLKLCKDIKKDGIAPWTYAGKYPYYLWDLLFTLASREGGRKVSEDIDNLEPKAWSNDSIVKAAEALYELKKKGYILEGTPGIDHIESQTKWNHGEAAFLPCGSWVKHEQGKKAPKDFVYATTGVFPFEGSKLPKLAWSSGGEPFIVPEQAKNKEGAYEYLRIMLSKKGSAILAESAQSPSILKPEYQTIKDSAAKAVTKLNTGADNVYRPQIADWYVDFKNNVEPVLGELLAGKTKPKDFLKKAQDESDKIAKNDKIKKFKQSY